MYYRTYIIEYKLKYIFCVEVEINILQESEKMRIWSWAICIILHAKIILSNGLLRQKYRIEKVIRKPGIYYTHFLNLYKILEIVPSAEI